VRGAGECRWRAIDDRNVPREEYTSEAYKDIFQNDGEFTCLSIANHSCTVSHIQRFPNSMCAYWLLVGLLPACPPSPDDRYLGGADAVQRSPPSTRLNTALCKQSRAELLTVRRILNAVSIYTSNNYQIEEMHCTCRNDIRHLALVDCAPVTPCVTQRTDRCAYMQLDQQIK